MESISSAASPAKNPIAALRRFSRPRAASAEERCELCSAVLPLRHQHLLDPAARQILCACEACAILFSEGAATKYRRVPRTIERWTDFAMSDMQWAGLGVPIALAFFFHSTPQQQVISMYPSPGGATEATLSGEAWQGLVSENAALAGLNPDVESLLVNRINGAREYYRAPIDECFKLVGLIRRHWRGLSGGAEVWKQIAAFFEDLNNRSIAASSHA